MALALMALLGTLPALAQYAAPDWTLPTPDGDTVNLHEKLAEGPVVVSFWATWCIPCLKEMPHLNRLAEKYDGKVTFIAISVDNSKSMSKVGPLVRSKGWDNLIVGQDAAGTVQQIFQVSSPPYTVVYDQNGSESFRHVGYKTGDEVELEHAIEDMLANVAMASNTITGRPITEFAASDWTLPTPEGDTINLHENLANGPVVVSFWATWCIPCLKEMPKLNELAGEYGDEVTFIAISVDNSKSMAKVGPLVRSKGWTNLKIGQDAAATVQQQVQVLSPPYTILYDRYGSEVYRHEGYKTGDEHELKVAIDQTLKTPIMPTISGGTAPGGLSWKDAVTATDQFEYSFETEDETEIFENWLDVSYKFGDFRTGIMLNSQAPSEDGNRRNEIVHRYVEYGAGFFDLRVGHFYGMFGRGLTWNSYEDRFIRVDTSLDGIYGKGYFGKATVQVFSGATGTTPVVNDPDGTITNQVDVRGVDAEYRIMRGLSLGASGMTYLPNLTVDTDEVKREYIGSGRLAFNHPNTSLYFEYANKTGYETDVTTADADQGEAYYGNLGLYAGPLSFSIERSDYTNFEVIARSDGNQPLNRPPALVREHIYSLLGRKPHNLNPDDEKGWQIEGNAELGKEWLILANGSQIENHEGETLFEEGYFHVEKDHLGNFRIRGGFDYQDSEGTVRKAFVTDGSWYINDGMTLNAQFEQQHVEAGVLGAYDQQWMKLELELPPRWTLDAIAETNNKYEAQFDPGEIVGDFFPSGQITYTLTGGGNLNLWFGQRQAGQLCAGGVCKFEPAFEGVEFYGIFRY